MPTPNTVEKRDQMRSTRYTRSELTLQDAQAKAEGYSSPDLWRRDVTIKAAEFGHIVRDGIQPVIEQAQQGMVDLAQQITINTRTLVEQGITDLRATVKTSVNATVQQEVQTTIADMEQRINERNAAQIAAGFDALQSMLSRRLDGIQKSMEGMREDTFNYVSALVAGPQEPADEAPPASKDSNDVLKQAMRESRAK